METTITTIYPEIAESNIRNRQNLIMCAATNAQLPKNFARDLFIDCETIERIGEMGTRKFALLLRENGTQLAYDKQSASNARYWIGNNEIEEFYVYTCETYKSCTESGKLVRVSEIEFRDFLSTLA